MPGALAHKSSDMDKIAVAPPKKPASSRPPSGKDDRHRPPFQFFPILILTILLFLLVRHEVQMSRKYVEGTEGYVYLDEDGNPQVIPEVHERLEKHKQKRETCVQYVAIATEDGYRACYTCPNGKKTIFLRKGEVWKFGETCDLKSRRNNPEYKMNRVELLDQNYGSKHYCFKVQLDSIYLYKKHHENLMRLKRTGIWLKRPPGNKIYR